MSILFTLLLFLLPISAYGDYNYSFTHYIYGQRIHYQVNIPNKTMEWIDYIPATMTIYINPFSVIQYRENKFNLFVKDLSLHGGKIGVRFYW